MGGWSKNPPPKASRASRPHPGLDCGAGGRWLPTQKSVARTACDCHPKRLQPAIHLLGTSSQTAFSVRPSYFPLEMQAASHTDCRIKKQIGSGNVGKPPQTATTTNVRGPHGDARTSAWSAAGPQRAATLTLMVCMPRLAAALRFCSRSSRKMDSEGCRPSRSKHSLYILGSGLQTPSRQDSTT